MRQPMPSKKAFDRLKSGVGSVKDAFVRAKDGIVKVWDKLDDGIRKPVAAALNWLNRNFIAKVKQLLNVDGYPVLRVDADGTTLVLDERSLREQFGLSGG